MVDSLLSLFAGWLATANELLTAANVILAASLLLYSLRFNLHHRVARAFAAVVAAALGVYLGDVLATVAMHPSTAEVWLRLQWLGIAFLPPAYLHLSDALLETTGLPSRGRRRLAVRVGYLLAAAWAVVAASTNLLVSDPTLEGRARHLEPGVLFPVFTLIFILGSAIAWINTYRAYLRCLTSATRRRMSYLLIASITLPFSVFPYLLVVGGQNAVLHPFIFWFVSATGNFVLSLMLLLMVYVVALFGTSQPDRVARSSLFQWLLRGPFVASTVLVIMVLTGRMVRGLGFDPTQVVAVAAVASLLLLQYGITLVRLPLERLLFYGGRADQGDLRRLQMLEERLLTANDTEQYLETVVAAVCDLLRVPSAFIASVDESGARVAAKVGPDDFPVETAALTQAVAQNGNSGHEALFVWDGYWVLPLHAPATADADGLAQPDEVLGLLALKARAAAPDLDEDETATLDALADRAVAALEDRRLQRNVFSAVDSLLSQVDKLQRLRVASKFASSEVLKPDIEISPDLVQSVREALTQYWGGPKLTNSPLLRLRVVEQALRDHDGNPANALRAVLTDAIERLKPEGQRRFTAEWILYNILEMKFMQGRRVREVAMRLAVSEADLYRKQRVAIEQVARMIAQMEHEMAEHELEVDYSVSG
jgi:hypothetical protein